MGSLSIILSILIFFCIPLWKNIINSLRKKKKVQILERFQGLKLFILWPLWDNVVQLIIQSYTELRKSYLAFTERLRAKLMLSWIFQAWKEL